MLGLVGFAERVDRPDLAVAVRKRAEERRCGRPAAIGLLPGELAALIRGVRTVEAVVMGEQSVDATPDELDDLEWSQPSIVAARAIPRGAEITADLVTLKPPARGLSPRMLPSIVGRRALYDIAEDEFITFGLVEL